jgi:hypothetical protein
MSKKDKRKNGQSTEQPAEPTTTTNATVDEPASATPAPTYEPTAEQKTQLADALAKGDFKTIAIISKAIAAEQSKLEKGKKESAKAAEEEKRKALAEVTITVKDMLVDYISQLRKTVAGMDKADCVAFKWDFASELNTVECKLFKSAAKAASTRTGGGGGATKKYDRTTEDLLAEFGGDIFNAETGQTFKEAHDSKTDGNWRYGIRVKLLKKAGVIK